MSRLKSELSWLRRKGAIKVGQENSGTTRACGRCQTELGLLLNRGALCPSCRQRVCKECRNYGLFGKDWVCIVCSKQIEIQLATGEWMNEFIRRPSRRRENNLFSAAEGVRKTLIRRSWSISSPTTSTCDLTTTEDVVKRKPPKKPPRKSLSSDENDPPWDATAPNKPSRRNSMSSFDGISSGRRSSRSVLGLDSTKVLQEDPSLTLSNPSLRGPPSKAQSTQYISSHDPPKYFFGSDSTRETPRPSTLPRRPRRSERPFSFGDFEGSPKRFHSIPRKRAPRSLSGPRGRSEPAPFKENLNASAYVSSGPITTTPISSSTPNGPSFPPVSQEPIVRRSSSRLSEGQKKIAGDSRALTGSGASEEVKPRDNNEGGSAPQLKTLNVRETNPFDSGMSESSVAPSPDTSDEGRTSPIIQKAPGCQLPRSNTSVTSGFASTGRPKRASSAPVRRCKSFQAGTSTKNLGEIYSRKISGIQVAKFVLELERGIQQTLVNMSPKKTLGLSPSDSFIEPISHPSKNSPPPVSGTPSGEDRSLGRHSALSSSDDVAINTNKVLPERNDYKIVFINSDSSKESEFNSSIESEHSSGAGESLRRRSFHRRSLDGSFGCQTPKGEHKSKLIDVAVMTDAKDSSIAEEEKSLESVSSLVLQKPPSPEEGSMTDAKDVPKISYKQTFEILPERVNFTNTNSEHSPLLPPLNTLDQNELNLMLQQTEVVQAEAQALQKALMGAFDPKVTPNPWILQKNSLNRSQNKIDQKHSSKRNQTSIECQNLKKSKIRNCKSLENFSDSFCNEKEFQSDYVNGKDLKFQNEYENVKLSQDSKVEKENLYENVNFRSDIIQPVKVCKSVSIQTDLEPLSWEEEDSYETADYSDVSYDSPNEERNTPQKSVYNIRTLPLSDKNARVPSSSRGYVIREQNECSRGKGQESFNPPFSYLPDSPPSATLPLPSAVHLRLALNQNSSSVSLSSECESVREPLNVVCDRAEVFKPSKSGKYGIKDVSETKVNSLKKENPKSASVYGLKDSLVPRVEFQRVFSDESNTPSERSPDLTSGGNNNSLHPPTSDRSLKTSELEVGNTIKNLFKMSSKLAAPENPASDAKEAPTHSQSNVNASEEVISPRECSNEALPSNANDVVNEEHSSATSEGDDTDEEIHVSRSYDVSKLDKDASESDAASSNHSEIPKEPSSVSGSETDEEKHVSREYDITRASSESESENGKNASGETKEINDIQRKLKLSENKEPSGANKEIKINKKYVKTNKLETNKVEKGEKVRNKTETKSDVSNNAFENKSLTENKIDGDVSDESKLESSDNNNMIDAESCSEINKVNILDNVEKTDLPECDQAMGNSVLVCNSEKENEFKVQEEEEEDEEEDEEKEEEEEEESNETPPLDSIEGKVPPVKDDICDTDAGAPFDTLDSVVENKSETESNLGLESDTLESTNEIMEKDKKNEVTFLAQINKGKENNESHILKVNNERREREIKDGDDNFTTNTFDDNETNNTLFTTTENNIEINVDKITSLSDNDLKDYTTRDKPPATESEEKARENIHSFKVSDDDSAATIDPVKESGFESVNLILRTESKETVTNEEKSEVNKRIHNLDEEAIITSENNKLSQSTLRKDDHIIIIEENRIEESKESDNNNTSNVKEGGQEKVIEEKSDKFALKILESQVCFEASQTTTTTTVIADTSERDEGPEKTAFTESDILKNKSGLINHKSNNCSECKPTEITGSVEVERGSGSCIDEAVIVGTLSDSHEQTFNSDISEKSDLVKDITSLRVCDLNKELNECSVNSNSKKENIKLNVKEICSSSESGHSSGGESDVETKELDNVVKINVAEIKDVDATIKTDSKGDGYVSFAMGTTKKGLKQESRKGSFQQLRSPSKFSKPFTPPVPLRKAKRSTSSDGLSSSSDIERSDADASDSADTVIEGNKLQNKTRNSLKNSISDEANRDSDRPSSADSLLQGADSESQCSDGSEEGNLITIVAVGEETIPKPSSQGKIYIRSDSTDSDVQIKPTCIVVTGSSGVESGDDCDNEDQSKKNNSETGNDVTILEVTSDHRKDHVMSVRVTSPESSRSGSPARKSNVSELQSMILTTRERQQQFRRSPTDIKESSSLTNYFTVTLGTDSPATPRRLNKTPEVLRRKVPERDTSESPSVPVVAITPTPTLTPSPSHTPSPTLTPTPDHSEGDLLAYEEHHPSTVEETSDKDLSLDGDNVFDGFYNDYDDHYYSYNDAEIVQDDADGTFDSIEDTESVGESNYSETSSEEGFEREELRGYDFTLHTIIEESCEESDYDKKVQEDDSVKRDPSELEKYFYFGLGNGPAESKKYANEESEYSDTFSETSSSIYSEEMESLDCEEERDPAELASSRLEKYFSRFERQPSIRSVEEESEIHTDESGSVGSDSEGSPSPEQPRKKLFRSRGVRSVSSSRSHGYSSDKGDGVISDGSHHSVDGDADEKTLVSGEDEGSTESEETAFDKGDGQFDTIKRRKKKKALSESSEKKMESDKTELKYFAAENKDEELNIKKVELNQRFFNECETTPKKVLVEDPNNCKDKSEEMTESDLAGRKYQSRDSGFIGSSDDLLKDKPEDAPIKETETKEKQPSDIVSEEAVPNKSSEKTVVEVETSKKSNLKESSPDNDTNNNKSENEERSSNEGKVSRSSTGSSVDLPPYPQSKGSHNLTRKDSFNNWSSDEETNIMMNKMRIFFKNMFSNVGKEVQKGERVKAPQLVMFEEKLTNLMRSVPGINDEQVKEIVEYLSSEETWSDSYDSSDYTSSDLEGAYARLDQADPELKSELQEQISASCQQIIKKFDQSREPSDSDSAHSLFGEKANSESSEASSKDTAFVYQKLMSSISHMKPDSDRGSIGSGSRSTSPSLLMTVMPYISNRLAALMHEVSACSENGDDADSFSGGNTGASSPRQKLFLPKKHNVLDNVSLDSSVDKSSLTSTSFESEDSPTDTEQSPESETGTPKNFRRQKLSIISEKSSTEDFTSLESQRTVFGSHDSPRYHFRSDTSKLSHSTPSQRSLEDRSGALSLPFGRNKEEEKFCIKEHIGLSKASRNGRRPEARKAKSHLSLEKIHHEEVKTTGERSESLGDLLDCVRSSSEFSSSYEQLDSDSTLKASDSLDRHIGSSSSNVRLNASSRGSLTTSSRGSLATSSRGSLNASSRGSLQGSSGPDEEEERKAKKLSPFRYVRRSSVPDASKEASSPEVRSTTLPRSTPAQILTTGTLPRSQSSQGPPSRSPSGLLNLHSSSSSASTDRPLGHHISGPRSARYHPPGYRPPPAGLPPKRTYSTLTLRKDRLWPSADESGSCVDDAISTASSATGGPPSRAPPPPSRLTKMGSGSPLGSPLGGSLGRASGNESVGGSLASFENSPDEEEAKRRDSDGGRSPLIALGPKSRSESLASVYSSGGEGRFGAVSVQGEIKVALQYNYKEGQLECHVIQCRDLAPVDTKRNRSDPYVKAYLLPDKSKSGKRKTKVKRHALNPAFDEVFKFGTTLSELESRTLWISVWHSDMFGRNVFLGEVLIPLSDDIFEDPSPRWHPLLDRNEPMEDLNYGAVLIVALKFVPPDVLILGGGSGSTRRSKRSRGALQVRVKEASGLIAAKSQSPPDPICKGVLMPEKGKSSKQKTNVIRKTSNPKWNHTMTFDDVTLQELTERSLELSIWNHDRFGSSEFLGGCRLNLGRGHHNNKIVEWLDASGLEQKLWEQMLDRPNLWVESSILLRPNIERPIYSSAFTD